jgi:hypothetical protein
MVKGTGYFPANALPARDPALLGDFYKQNPNHQTAITPAADADRLVRLSRRARPQDH